MSGGTTNLGFSVCGSRDLDADRVVDVLSGTMGTSGVLAFSGATGALLYNSAPGFNSFGHSVASIPDVTGDAVGDSAVGVPNSIISGSNSPRVLMFRGATGAIVTTILSPNGGASDSFGWSISYKTVTGVPCVLIRAPYAFASTGAVYLSSLSSGSTATLLRNGMGAVFNICVEGMDGASGAAADYFAGAPYTSAVGNTSGWVRALSVNSTFLGGSTAGPAGTNDWSILNVNSCFGTGNPGTNGTHLFEAGGGVPDATNGNASFGFTMTSAPPNAGSGVCAAGLACPLVNAFSTAVFKPTTATLPDVDIANLAATLNLVDNGSGFVSVFVPFAATPSLVGQSFVIQSPALRPTGAFSSSSALWLTFV